MATLHQAIFSCTYIRHVIHVRGTWLSHCECFKPKLLNWLEEDNCSLGANEQILLATQYDIQLHLQPAMEWLQNRISASASGIRSRFYRGPIEVQKNHAPFLPTGNPAASRPQQQQAARRSQQQAESSKQKTQKTAAAAAAAAAATGRRIQQEEERYCRSTSSQPERSVWHLQVWNYRTVQRHIWDVKTMQLRENR